MGHADHLGWFPGDHRGTVALGSGAPRTVLSHLYATAMAKLVSEGRLHHRGLHAGASAALHCQLGWIDNVSDVVDDRRRAVVVADGYLHRVSLRAGKGARYVAEPVVAAAPRHSGGPVGFRRSFAA